VSRRARTLLAVVALAVLGATLVVAVADLEPFGHYPGPYGDVLAKVEPSERHEGQLVTGVVLDYRGFDTVGEELILFTAACGCVALLRLRRRTRGESEGPSAPDRPAPSFAARALGAAMVGPVVVVAAYIVLHGHLTPGGGFAGGIIGAGALVLAYAAGQGVRLGRVGSIGLLEAVEALGAGGLVLVALGGLIAVGATMQNFLPLGTEGMLLSTGTIPIGNAAIGIEVAGAMALIVAEFLEQTLVEDPA
jgi:multicomponent Na+:H+ antiporter subunit B